MERVGHERERVHLRRGNRHARWIRSRVELRLDPQPGGRPRGPDAVHDGLKAHRQSGEFSPGLLTRRFWRFVLFLYFTSLTGYFARPGFASTALGAVSGGVGAVALFNVGYQIPQTIAVLLLSSFQGLYTPMFARLLLRPDDLRTAYQEACKVHALLLIPAAAGLLVMLDAYIPLIYGQEFCSALGFLDSGLTVFGSTLPRPARRGHVAPGRDFDSGTSPASTARCTFA